MASNSLARIVIEAGFAGADYLLRDEMRTILAAVPDFISDPLQQARCEAILLFEMGRPRAAAKRLKLLPDDDCVPLREMLATTTKRSQP